MAETLGEKIRINRINLGWSQVYLAKQAGISKSVISDIERGKRNNPSIRTLWKIAKALGFTLADFLNLESLNTYVGYK